RVFFFFQAEDGIRDFHVTGVQTCALPISPWSSGSCPPPDPPPSGRHPPLGPARPATGPGPGSPQGWCFATSNAPPGTPFLLRNDAPLTAVRCRRNPGRLHQPPEEPPLLGPPAHQVLRVPLDPHAEVVLPSPLDGLHHPVAGVGHRPEPGGHLADRLVMEAV